MTLAVARGRFKADHDAYIAAAPEPFQPLLVQLRAQLSQTLPDAEEIIAYDMPGFGFGKSISVGYAAFSKQCGLYVSNGAISAHVDDIADAGLKATKTGSCFPKGTWIVNEPIYQCSV